MAGTRTRSLGILAAAAVAACADTSTPRDEGAFWWPATGPDQPASAAITGLTPSSAFAGDPAFVLTVAGTGFEEGSFVSWNGSARPTTFVSRGSLRAEIAASDVATAGPAWVAVVSPGLAPTPSWGFTISNPVPVVSSLSPSPVTAGSVAVEVAVAGRGFVPSSTVTWNGASRPTTFVSTTLLRVVLLDADVATTGAGSVVVQNPPPGGGTSTPVTLPVTHAVPTVTAMSPSSIAPGSPRFTLTVTGAGFGRDTVVRWAGSPRPTAFVSSSILHASVDAADLVTAGPVAVSVFSPPPDGGAASAGTFRIEPSAASTRAVAYQLDPAHAGHVDPGGPLVFPGAEPAWVVTLSGAASYPLVADGRVFAVSAELPARLHALDLATGAAAWSPVAASSTSSWAAHAWDGAKVFVVDGDGVLRAFDAATGAPGWELDLPLQYSFSAPPTASGGTVYVGGAGVGGTLYAVAEADGQLRWTQPVANGNDSSPAVGPDGVYVSYPCQVYKLDLLTGSPIWHRDGGCSGGGGSTPALAHGRVYVRDWVADPVGSVYDAFDATFLGTFGAGWAMVPIPAFGGATGYFLTSGVLQARDAAGTPLWTFGGGAVTAPPIVVGDAVVVGSSSGAVYALDAATGALRWTGNAGAPLEAGTALAAGEGYLVVPAGRRIVAWRIVP